MSLSKMVLINPDIVCSYREISEDSPPPLIVIGAIPLNESKIKFEVDFCRQAS